MSQDDKKALVPRPGSEIARPSNRRNPVISRMSRDLLARAQAQQLHAARFRIGDYELREPDYRQILKWAKTLNTSPDAILKTLSEHPVLPPQEFVDDNEPIELSVVDGAIVSLPWDFGYLPYIPNKWEAGLCICTLAFEGSVYLSNLGTEIKPILPKLKRLVWYLADAETIDLAGVPNLTVLKCSFIPGCDVDSSPINELNLSLVPKLTELDCRYRDLAELDLSPVPKLKKLDCSENELTKLDLSPVPELIKLDCSFNNKITELDLSQIPKLKQLDCRCTQIEELDLTLVSHLTVLCCSFTYLDLKAVPELAELCCWSASLTTLDLSSVPGLTELEFFQTQLAALDLSPVPRLVNLICWHGKLTELDLSPVTKLKQLNCSWNQLANLDLSPATGLQKLDCRGNHLTELNLSPVPGLAELRCDSHLKLFNAPKGLEHEGGQIISYTSTSDASDDVDDLPF
ncbi:MAG: leucine-rich repeat domain-containing protein [Lamprobacter sp.]|uniref:leucine-rich repeat domain-containing protein n=1 Tax=Lamprobacter sp. TaxID=3100796 RepID=UPI002B25FE60|nr:leucine-rich repeat domain-containing protein [Lamprobacter sp.]MEA3643733.1 leucine-rich repeat domain-containing protein [Lamprobacter sp.]